MTGASAAWHAELAVLDGAVERDVLLEVSGGRLVRVQPGVTEVPQGVTRLRGCTLPGLVNAHSHAFHRALRGRRDAAATDFWGWREQMYALAVQLGPHCLWSLARACYAEMALAGITTVGEFHYLHHQPSGRPYPEPHVMADALRAAAEEAGVRLTLLDTLYLQGGMGEGRNQVQSRFADRDAHTWAERVGALDASWHADTHARVGAAVHSVRAVDPAALATAADAAREAGWPLHVHVSEQPAENDACQAAHGCTPTALLGEAGVLGAHTTAVHATHASDADLRLLAEAGSTVCLCPTTERDLADGVGPARACADHGIPLAFGSDSHAVIDLFEEARAAEMDERLVTGTRSALATDALLHAVTDGGARSLGWDDAGRLAPGCVADFVTVGLGSVRLAGAPVDDLAAALVLAATAADVTDVVVAGRPIVAGGRHLLLKDVPGALDAAIAEAWGAVR